MASSLELLDILTTINPVFKAATEVARKDLDKDVDKALSNMLLPDPLIELLGPPMTEMGFPLKKSDVPNLLNKPVYHHCTHTANGLIALLHLPKWFLEDDTNVKSISSVQDSFYEYGGLFFFSMAEVRVAFERVRDTWRARNLFKQTDFFGGKYIKELESFDLDARKIEIKRLLKLDLPPEARRESRPRAELDDETKQKVAEILIGLAENSPGLGTKGFFKKVLVQTILPSDWRTGITNGLSDDATLAAYDLLDSAIAQGENKAKPGHTVLGSLLETLAKYAGDDESKFLLQTISSFNLIDKKD
jgi:hypothetical protein